MTMPARDLTAVEPPRALSPDSPPSRAALDQQRQERLWQAGSPIDDERLCEAARASDSTSRRRASAGAPLAWRLVPDEREPMAVVGIGWVGLVAAIASPSSARGLARDIVPEKVEFPAEHQGPDPRPGLPELVAKNAERLPFTTDMGEVLDDARLLFVCVDTPPTYSGDTDLSRVESVLDELGDRRARAGDEGRGPGRHRPLDPAPRPRHRLRCPTPSS